MSLTLDDFRPQKSLFGGKPGALVQVRPCGDEYGKRTYIGILVGDAPIGFYRDKSGKPFPHRNPMILIPETNSVVFGCESWWGRIKSVEDLKQITNEDIENVWYVKLLKEQLGSGGNL